MRTQLVLNDFVAEDKPSKLMSTMLQNMFPSINIQTVSYKLWDTKGAEFVPLA